MFGRAFFGAQYFGPRYFGVGSSLSRAFAKVWHLRGGFGRHSLKGRGYSR